MPAIYKILDQTAPAANTPTLAYGPVGAGTSTIVSTLAVCNRGTTAATYRISIRENGEADSSKQYLVYDAAVPGNSTATWTIGVTLTTGDAIWVQASNANLTFQSFGSEIN